MIVSFIILAILSYFIGSIATSVWVGKLRYDLDIRNHGSGNAGATNTFRVLGKKAGIFVMAIDVLKGFLATSLPVIAMAYQWVEFTENEFVVAQICCGIGATLGHVFPVYERFKGGKGVATLLGMLIAINWLASVICVGIFLVILIISKYVSLGSMLGALAFPIMMLLPKFNHNDPNPILIGFGTAVFCMVVFTHKKNIKRLIEGEENKTYLVKKK